jgi:hypothetical protein
LKIYGVAQPPHFGHFHRQGRSEGDKTTLKALGVVETNPKGPGEYEPTPILAIGAVDFSILLFLGFSFLIILNLLGHELFLYDDTCDRI